MECSQLRILVTRFHDGELPPPLMDDVRFHLGQCPHCSQEWVALQRLDSLWERTRPPEPAPEAWIPVSSRVAAGFEASCGRSRWKKHATVAAAVFLMVVAGTAWALGLMPWIRGPANGKQVDLSHYLEPRGVSPCGAARPLQEVAKQVNFQIIQSQELPHRYRLANCAIGHGEQCDVVEYKYAREDRDIYVVLNACNHPVSMGKRHVMDTMVHGKPAKITQCGERLCACWVSNGTSVSIVGPHDLCELISIVRFLDEELAKQVANQE